MPQPACHLRLSNQILETWIENPSLSPFDSTDPINRAAFRHGSLGPDMGFFPGAEPFLARLSHRGPTGDVARELLRHANTAVQRAFTYGWVTHVLLDAAVHPHINESAAGIMGVRLEDASPSALEHTHIRLEIGLDLTVHRADPSLQRLRLTPLFDSAGVGFISRALAAVHGVSFSHDVIAGAHRRVGQVLGPMLGLQATMAFARVDGAQGAITAAVWSARAGLGTLQAVASRVKGPDSKTAAFLRPLRIDHDLSQRIHEAVARFRAEFQSHVESALATLPNYNIDTGRIEVGRHCESAA